MKEGYELFYSDFIKNNDQNSYEDSNPNNPDLH